MVKEFLAAELRKISSVPILDLHRAPIEEDVEMRDVTSRSEAFSSAGARTKSQDMQHPDQQICRDTTFPKG